jgi:2-polyprenyl-3-methyl-5-hydroxy-6-metoxy-1,4-benzoquinol methylase
MKANFAIYLNFPFDGTNPSIRLRLLNIRKPLRKLGVDTDHIYRYEDLAPYQNILIGHFSKEAIEQCKNLRKQGKTLFYSHTEDLWHLDYQSETFNLCDYIICCSTALAKNTQARLTSPFTRCIVIPDMAEGPHPTNGLPPHQPSDKEALSVLYCGMGGNSYLARQLKPTIEKLGMKLTMITEHADADIKWNRDTYLQDMAKADIAICPQNYELQACKSNVKLSTALSLGLPTISSPLQAYKEIIREGYNGLIASNDQEWEAALLKLKDYQTRCNMSKAAWETGLKYWPDRIAEKYRDFLMICQKKVIFINNTLPQKYMSYGDRVLEILRFAGHAVYEEYRYEDIDSLPQNVDMQVFIEVRYDTEDLEHPIKVPRVLITKEDLNINHLGHFSIIITPLKQLADKWTQRGFVNVHWIDNLETLSYPLLQKLVDEDITKKRQAHNLVLHDAHINAFHHLIPPEERWNSGNRDKEHIKFTMENTKPEDKILDIGSADGWLSLYLATQKRQVSALEFVQRGMDWTQQHAQRLGVSVDLRKGFIENVGQAFLFEKFDSILVFELMEHLDLFRIPWYLNKMEKLLNPGGSILVSLPLQDLQDNPEHLWSPNEKLIKKVFQGKKDLTIKWTDIPNHGVPGVWFIRYTV